MALTQMLLTIETGSDIAALLNEKRGSELLEGKVLKINKTRRTITIQDVIGKTSEFSPEELDGIFLPQGALLNSVFEPRYFPSLDENNAVRFRPHNLALRDELKLLILGPQLVAFDGMHLDVNQLMLLEPYRDYRSAIVGRLTIYSSSIDIMPRTDIKESDNSVSFIIELQSR